MLAKIAIDIKLIEKIKNGGEVDTTDMSTDDISEIICLCSNVGIDARVYIKFTNDKKRKYVIGKTWIGGKTNV